MVLRHALVAAALAARQEQLARLLARTPRVVLVTATATAAGLLGVELGQFAAGRAGTLGQAVLVEDEELATGTGAPRVQGIALGVAGPEDAARGAGIGVPADAPALLRAEIFRGLEAYFFFLEDLEWGLEFSFW